jgi:hypothetical protein
MRWMVAGLCGVVMMAWGGPGPAWAQSNCPPVEEQPVKIEAWLSKRFLKDFRQMRRELGAMGYTYVALWPYPGENPSRVAAVGRCVPVYIAQHALTLALQYYGEVKSLVHQNFVHGHWIGLGTSLFAENSQQPISEEQLKQLLDPSLDSLQFHKLYRKFTLQEKEVPAFGLQLPNPKLMK